MYWWRNQISRREMANADCNDKEERITREMSAMCLDGKQPSPLKVLELSADKPKLMHEESTLSKTLSLEEPKSSLLSWGPVKSNKSFDDIVRQEANATFHDSHTSHSGKCRKLQERRGSSQSLTIAVKTAENVLPTVVTPRECSATQFLLTSGNCMTRTQLRNCLRDVRNLHTEFWSIPANVPDQVDRISGSSMKNRYRTVLPNPHSRVRLPSDTELPGDDYINANYIRSYNGLPKAYIATQGPLSHTVYDFWLMAFAEKSPAIVMITKLVEGGKAKCEAYIPEVGEESHGDLSVRFLSCVENEGYAVRELILTRGDESRRITHFWYTDWPDHKTPDNPRTLLHMADAVESIRRGKPRNECIQKTLGPIIVHCSAGLGRTGCFLALCHGLNQLHNEGKVDVLSIVCALRCDRGGMVQTAEQYEFIHRGLCLFERTLSDYDLH